MKDRVFLALFFTIFCLSCNTPKSLYTNQDKGKFLVGDLTEVGYNNIKEILTAHSKSELKDTLIIRYDYNHESCWSMLDNQDNSYIKSVISGRQTQIKNAVMNRQGVSVFSFREEGSDINKLKKWDSTIIIDTNHKLFNALFFERSTCGNSIIILPDRKFVFLRSDSHFEALKYSKDGIEQILLP